MGATVDHRGAALAKANRIKRERALLVGSIGKYPNRQVPQERVAELIESPPEALLNMPVGELLGHVKRYGEERSRKLLGAEGVSEGRLVGELTERQRRAIAERLRSGKGTGR